jgi:hypothetical protein
MSKKPFNPSDWLTNIDTEAKVPKVPIVPKVPVKNAKNHANPENHNKITVQPFSLPSLNSLNSLEPLTQRIEASATDIAPTYSDWRDLGFALADALGESGREYYHRISRFYPRYTESETNRQYDNCLKSHGHGITVKTLYHLAKSAGIDIRAVAPAKNAVVPIVPKVPTVPNQISKMTICQNGNLPEVAISEFEISKLPNIQNGNLAIWQFGNLAIWQFARSGNIRS